LEPQHHPYAPAMPGAFGPCAVKRSPRIKNSFVRMRGVRIHEIAFARYLFTGRTLGRRQRRLSQVLSRVATGIIRVDGWMRMHWRRSSNALCWNCAWEFKIVPDAMVRQDCTGGGRHSRLFVSYDIRVAREQLWQRFHVAAKAVADRRVKIALTAIARFRAQRRKIGSALAGSQRSRRFRRRALRRVVGPQGLNMLRLMTRHQRQLPLEQRPAALPAECCGRRRR
jgi:hypothetical protein